MKKANRRRTTESKTEGKRTKETRGKNKDARKMKMGNLEEKRRGRNEEVRWKYKLLGRFPCWVKFRRT